MMANKNLFMAEQEQWQRKELAKEKRLQRRQVGLQLTNNQLPVSEHNRMVVLMNELAEQIRELEKDDDFEKTLKEYRSGFSRAREAYVENILDARTLADQLDQEWEDLSEKGEAKELVVELSQALGKEVKLESSALAQAKRRLAKIEESVMSDQIELRSRGGNTLQLDVSFNGKHTEEMMLDSGASLITLPHKLAEQMDIAPAEDAPVLTMVLADGRQVEGRMIQIPEVRVGRFIATNVPAAVMPPSLPNAEPLLGMSYLQNFQFHIDPKAKKLTMTRLAGQGFDEKPSTKPKKPKK
jgi:aspartyl protease family protein